MKTFSKKLKAILLLIGMIAFTMPTFATTTIEDAEDGTTSGWSVYDNNPPNATISNVVDAEEGKVIALNGDGIYNGYMLGHWGSKGFQISTKQLSWKMKYNERFSVYVIVGTEDGNRYLWYTPEDRSRGLALGGRYVHHGLGADALNGEWHTFIRDLEADLKEYSPELSVLETKAFLVRGSGYIDTIVSSNDFTTDNNLPTANAGADQVLNIITTDTTVTLDGTASTAEGDASIVKYEWFYEGESIGEGATLDVDSVPPGTYTVTLMVTDSLGNTASDTVNVTVTINDVTDTTKPVITLLGDATVTLTVGDTYTDAGAIATDDIDGNITSNIQVTGLPIDTSAEGNYTVTYGVSDSAGNVADVVTRTVTVNGLPDTIKPVITLLGDATVILTVGDTYTDAGATATDDVDGDITANIQVTGLPIDTSAEGNYTVTYAVSDSAGNMADVVTRNVVVNGISSLEGNITISGIVKAQHNGQTLNDVSLALLKDGNTIENNKNKFNGTFSFNTLMPNTQYILIVKKKNYATQIVPIKTLEKSTNLDFDIILVQSNSTQTFSATDTSTINGEYGLSVKLNESSFVDGSNQLVEHDINLTITALNTATQEGKDSLPGDLSNIAALGAAELFFTDSITGEKVNLANGSTAEVILPLFNLTTSEGVTLSEGDSIGLWSLNENTGIWQDEGNATVVSLASSPTGLGAKATVTHFSWWAVSARSIVKAFVHIKAIGSSDSGYLEIKARTDANVAIIAGGKFVVKLNDILVRTTTIPGWASSKTCFWGEAIINSSLVVTPEQCINAEPNQHYNLEFDLENTPPPATNRERFYLYERTLLNTELTKDFGYINLDDYYATAPEMKSFQITSGSLPSGVSFNNGTISGVATEVGDYRARGTAFTFDNRAIPFKIWYYIRDTSNAPVFMIGANHLPTQSELGTISLPLDGTRYVGISNMWFKISEDNGNMNLDIAQLNIGKVATKWEIVEYYAYAANNPDVGTPHILDKNTRSSLSQNGLLTINMPLPSVLSRNASTGVYEESYIIKEVFVLKASNGSKSDTIRVIFEYDELVTGGGGPTWQDNVEVTTNALSWSDAIEYCKNLTLDGFTDWKLPTLEYFNDMSRAESSWVNVNKLIGVYWLNSSTDDEYADFYIAGDTLSDLKTNLKGVRCVRGEPSN